MKLFLKLVLNDFSNESRDKRELSVVNKFNYKIIVIAKGEHNGVDSSNNYEIHRRTTRPLGDYKILSLLNRLVSFFSWGIYARKLKPNCISCHDLAALLIGWISTLFVPKKNRPLLVYDSHEFELGRNTNGTRNKLSSLLISKLEKFLMNKCEFSIMVNDSIADEVQRIHNLKTRPVVVRNIPNYWNLNKNDCIKRKKEFCELLNVPVDSFVVMYHGSIRSGRGIEILLKAIQKNDNVVVVILGYSDSNYLGQLKNLVEELKINNRVLFHEAVNIDVLWQYVGAADVGMLTIPAVSKSYYYMLPNKFFENIQSLTPIIGSNFPEITKVVKKYDIGLLVDPENLKEVANAIEQMRINKTMYDKFKSNLIKVKDELCWENESKVLEQAYKNILN